MRPKMFIFAIMEEDYETTILIQRTKISGGYFNSPSGCLGKAITFFGRNYTIHKKVILDQAGKSKG
ncbi:MAG: hypothetical protein ABIJ41_04220 [Candidatus Omnitrophota bacterium]